MKKEEKVNLAYNNEKAKHGTATILLFHVGDHYEAYHSDADILAELAQLRLCSISGTIPFVRIRTDKLEEYMNRLLDAGHAVCISEVRGTSGSHILESL